MTWSKTVHPSWLAGIEGAGVLSCCVLVSSCIRRSMVFGSWVVSVLQILAIMMIMCIWRLWNFDRADCEFDRDKMTAVNQNRVLRINSRLTLYSTGRHTTPLHQEGILVTASWEQGIH